GGWTPAGGYPPPLSPRAHPALTPRVQDAARGDGDAGSGVWRPLPAAQCGIGGAGGTKIAAPRGRDRPALPCGRRLWPAPCTGVDGQPSSSVHRQATSRPRCTDRRPGQGSGGAVAATPWAGGLSANWWGQSSRWGSICTPSAVLQGWRIWGMMAGYSRVRRTPWHCGTTTGTVRLASTPSHW